MANLAASTLVLPSASSAAALVAGDRSAIPKVIWHMLGRAALIGTGLYLAGAGRKTVPLAVAGSAAIEVFVLWYAHREQIQGTTTIKVGGVR